MPGLLHDHTCLAIAALALLIFILGFTGAPLILWTLVVAGFLYGMGASTTAWIIFGVIAVVLNIRPIRAVLISSIVLKTFKALNLIPAISETERVAIEAGVVWVEKELFSGKPNFKMMMNEPYPQLTPEEQAFIDGPTEKLCQMIDDWRIWQDREIPENVMNFIKKERFFGMIVPKKYGGLEFTALCHSEVVKKVSSRSLAAGITVMVPNSLGPAELLNHYGTEKQKEKYLKRLANGEEVPCFALTEPNAGSDAGSLTSSGELFKGDDGKLYIKLNWEKRWITLAAISTILGLAFRLKDPKNLLGKGEDLGITCALIPSNTPGVTLGLRHDPLGVPFYNCPTRGKDVVVLAEDAIIGGMEGAGKGWGMLMECLGAGRGISLPAQSTGGTQQCALVASAHATVRKQFGISIGAFEGVEELLARIASNAYLLEAARRYTCGAIDKGIKPPVVTAIAKYNATEIGRRSVIDAMDILGGAGISRGPRNVLSSGYIAMPIGITVEGANVMTRTLIIFGQGALRAHPWAFQEVKAVESGNLMDFDRAFFGHVGHVVRNLFRSVGLSVTRGRLACAPSGTGPVAHYYRKLAWSSASFAIMADIAMGMLGGQLKFREQLTGRFADILSWMYLGTATLRRWDAEGRRQEDLPYVHYTMETAFMHIQRGFDGIFQNFRPAGLTWFFRGVLGTWSMLNRFTAGPNDKLTHRVASLAQTPGEQRTRFFTDGIYVPKDMKEQIALLEAAFLAVKAADATERKVRKAVRSKQIAKQKGAKLYEEALAKNVISKAEFDSLAHAEELRWKAIQVDEFTLEQYKNRV